MQTTAAEYEPAPAVDSSDGGGGELIHTGGVRRLRSYSSDVGADEQQQQEIDYASLDSVSPPYAAAAARCSPRRSAANAAHPPLDIDLDLGVVTASPLEATFEEPRTLPAPVACAASSGEPRFGSAGVYGALILAQLFWSGFHLFAKMAFEHMPPMVLPMLRAIGTAPIMFVICYWQDRNFWRLPLADLKLLALIGCIVCMGCQNLFNLGLMLTTAADGGITQPAVPVFAACMAIVLKREQGGWLKMSGIACAVVGTVCIVVGETYYSSPKAADDNSSPLASGNGGGAPIDATEEVNPGRRLLGIGCFMLQCFLFAIYLLIQKPLLARIPTTTITFYTFLFAIPGTSVIAAYFAANMDWAALPPMWYVSIAYTVAFASIGGFLLFSYATRHLPASASSMGVTLQPLTSSLLGAIFLGELLTWAHALGGLFLIAGLAIVIYSRHREAQEAKLQTHLDLMRHAQELQTAAVAPEIELETIDIGPVDVDADAQQHDSDDDGEQLQLQQQQQQQDGPENADTPSLAMSPDSGGASPLPSDPLQPHDENTTALRNGADHAAAHTSTRNMLQPSPSTTATAASADANASQDNPFDF